VGKGKVWNVDRFSFSSSSVRKVVELEEELSDRIARDVLDPESGMSIRTLGMLRGVTVRDGGDAYVSLDMRVPGYPQECRIVEMCKEVMGSLDWVKQSRVEVTNELLSLQSATSSLSKVRHVIGISSCKGGVGKSTVSMLLASALRERGLKVGLLDADVYGPSLPHLANVPDVTVRRDPDAPDFIFPLEDSQGIKMLSFGYVNPKAGAPGAGGRGAAVMRGPVVSRVINQMLHKTQWGELDYLLVDMPPGTGDIQITLSQAVSFTGVVVVTTPHLLSVADVAKGIDMFRDLKVPTLAVVENMSYFECRQGEKYYPFGKGGREATVAALGGEDSTPNPTAGLESASNRIATCPFHMVPLSRGDVAQCNSHLGPSISLGAAETEIFSALARDMIVEVMFQTVQKSVIPVVKLRGDTLVLQYLNSDEAVELRVPVHELRRRDPKTGDIVAQQGRVEVSYKDASVAEMDFKGNYGVSFVWTDGHFEDIFTYDALYKIAKSL